jgi:hypothetical protein
MILASDGRVHVAYSWGDRRGLKHVTFNLAWLRGRT